MTNMGIISTDLRQAGADEQTVRWVEQIVRDACCVIEKEDGQWNTRACTFYPGLKDARDPSIISVSIGAEGRLGRAEGRTRDELRA